MESQRVTLGAYRIVFIDIDGTLLDRDGSVRPRTRAALSAAEAGGCAIVICTGRNRWSAERVAKLVGGHGFGIVLNGALVVDWESGEALHRAPLPAEAAREAIRIARALGQAAVTFGD